MLTIFRTQSLNLFSKIRQYIHNKRIHASSSFENGQYVISVFELSPYEREVLVSKMTAYMHLVPKREHAA